MLEITNLKEAQHVTKVVGFGNLNRNEFKSQEKAVYFSFDADHDKGELLIEVETGNMHPVYSNPSIVTTGAFTEQTSMKEILEIVTDLVNEYRENHN